METELQLPEVDTVTECSDQINGNDVYSRDRTRWISTSPRTVVIVLKELDLTEISNCTTFIYRNKFIY